MNAFKMINASIDGQTVTWEKNSISIIKRFYFNSAIKRMSVIAETKQGFKLLTKGSPEVIMGMLSKPVANYKQTL